MFAKRRKMQFKRNKKASTKITLLFVSLLCTIVAFLYFMNSRIMPTYLQYAEVQTQKIASYVVSKAINSRTSSVLDVNDIIVDLPPGTSDMVTTKFNTDIINQVRAETTALVKEYLEQAESGDLTHLPNLDNVEYDVGRMEAGDGIVFFVPMGQALNLPLLGNLGPTIPIRFHIIGNVKSDVQSTIREFGINNAYVEVSIHLEVNVQIIIPLATSSATVDQNIPVAIGLIRGTVPYIYTEGGDGTQPSIEVPLPIDELERLGE